MNARRSSSASGDLEISEDLEFQRRSWAWEHAGQWVVAAFVVAAMCGLFGGGPVSRTTTTGEGGLLQVEYPRFVRNQSDYQLKIQVESAAVREGKIHLWIDTALADALHIEAVSPEPETVDLGDERMLYQFRVGAAERLAPIVLRAKGDAMGLERGRIGLLEGEAVLLQSFFFP
jgi:hypothetical protein